MAITWTDDVTSINTCENKGDWTGTGFSNPDDNNSGSSTPIYREGTGCMGATASSGTTGDWTDTIAVDLTDKALIWWMWLSGPTEIAYFTYLRARITDGTAYIEYDYWPEMTTLGVGGWYPAVLWPTDDGATFINSSGTLDESAIDDIGIYADNASGNDAKLVGWDYIHAMSYIGAAGDTVTLEDFVSEDASNNFGVVTQVGTTFQAQCNLQYGGTGTTTVSESNKTLTFRGANSEHPVGLVFASGGTATNITWTDMVFNWTYPQDAFTLTASPATFKFDGCQFNAAGDIQMPTTSATRWVLNCKFNDCGKIFTETIQFENNIIANATIGVEVESTSHNMKNNSYLNCGHALEFSTPGTYVIDGDYFDSNTYDILNNSGGQVTITATNGTNISTYQNVGGGSATTINNAVALTVKVVDAANLPILNAQVGIYKSSDGTQMMNEDTLATGFATENFNYPGTEVAIYVRVRKSSTGTTRYTNFSTTGTVNANGYTTTVVMKTDDITEP